MSNDATAVAELHAAFKLQSAAFIKDQSPSLETRQGYLAKIAGMVRTFDVENEAEGGEVGDVAPISGIRLGEGTGATGASDELLR